jgi:hypothetical protein
MTALERARALRQRGLSVFPIPVGSKVPTLPWKPYQSRLATDEELVAWFGDGQPSNIGVVTGNISHVVVVDADTQVAIRHCERWVRYTPWRTRTSRGAHFWFQYPGMPTVNRSADLLTPEGPLPIHLRADGGYVLAPGSVHPSGARYRACGDWSAPRHTLPPFVQAWFPAATTPRQTMRAPAPLPLYSGVVVERARRYLAAIPRPEIGHGSDAAVLSAACRLVRGFELPRADSEALLWEWCGHRPGWTFEWVATKVANADRYGSEARGGLR